MPILIRHATLSDTQQIWFRSLHAGPWEVSGFQPLMHFSFYLMIAALVLVGFEVAYAIYQLTLFVL